MRPILNKGFTLIEVMISASIIAFILAGLVMLGKNLFEKTAEVQMAVVEDREIANLIERVIANFPMHQISFEATDMKSRDSKLQASKLPLAWDEEVVAPISECDRCPGRMGVLVKPHESYPGIYVVHLSLTNKKLFDGQREYRFLATYK